MKHISRFIAVAPGEAQNPKCLQGHTKWITSVAWEPAHLALPCRRFVSGSKDASIRVWDAVTRQTLFSMSSHTLAVSCVKWGGDGLIYSGSKDCSINVRDSKVPSRFSDPASTLQCTLGLNCKTVCRISRCRFAPSNPKHLDHRFAAAHAAVL